MAQIPYDASCKADKSEDAITLMLQYMRNELAPDKRDKVTRAIRRCESCGKLYKELLLFYDDSQTVLYEVNNQEEVQRTDRLLDTIIQYYEPQTPEGIQLSRPTYALEEILEADCLGCGA